MKAARAKELGRIGVIMGGDSSERDISLKSGHAVAQALTDAGCCTREIILASQDSDELYALLTGGGCEVAFIALHGRFGEDGRIQALLEKWKIPYTGSGIEASRLAIDKIAAQTRFRDQGIPVADFFVLEKDAAKAGEITMQRHDLFPVVVKPAREGSSIGVTIVRDKTGLPSACDVAFGYDERVLVEQYIKGRELTVGILDGQPLPVVEIRPGNAFFDFAAKYEKGMTEYLVPAPMAKDVTRLVQDTAQKAFMSLGCSDYARVDLMLDRQDHPFVMEINTVPGFTATSLLPMAAAAADISFPELCMQLVGLAYGKKEKYAQRVF